jgi:hypothetical protein
VARVTPNTFLGAGLFVATATPLSILLVQSAGPIAGTVLAVSACLSLAGLIAALVRQFGAREPENRPGSPSADVHDRPA